jgi:hypothetical protein
VIAGKEGLPNRYVILRWRRKLADPARFEDAVDHASARYARKTVCVTRQPQVVDGT